MRVEVLYFAGLREAVGTERERVELPDGVATAAALRAHLRSRGGAWAEALAETRTLRVAVDQAMAAGDAPLRDGAEVAFFPPVTGG
ncbi:MAG: molybdopterin converting factor subunit 1 [Burkholderiaceae bacterium]|nr:molybdopterin converting factor subunit 1 [Burkholderiales bacterium]MCZ8102547.1 molybdopterin converting factor subunit 1 [Burkholderiales bacterium]MCZ8336609.1 molybdopterin converting factor subunit 1 [Burkholderiaceae bacterium]